MRTVELTSFSRISSVFFSIISLKSQFEKQNRKRRKLNDNEKNVL